MFLLSGEGVGGTDFFNNVIVFSYDNGYLVSFVPVAAASSFSSFFFALKFPSFFLAGYFSAFASES